MRAIEIINLLQIFIFFIFNISCEKPIKKTEGEPFFEEREISCTHAGICLSCFPGFDGKASCGMKFSPICPGRKKALIKIVPVIEEYKSGEKVKTEKKHWVKDMSSCR